ncbi:ACP S-malonyltransferase [Thermoflexus sp.]|uniref:ACP S-malonyltransferase n=1 Tax=Thermoflexus sp. TaxID=1969742 RepID=UPI0025D5C993|nr:ACP S-malonyltransferase [Thermoflexus sp.]MCS6964328.1 ACP S-malonyltransferase [Thermoflexus sp.]MCX7689493.1 ACP S-malonyltransferase [Thermoflexus sp.]MDW8184911.1 ACP S-malonyltransferase [Anaerolineae bacterium]
MSGRLAFVFPGQGSQYVGMGRALYEAFPEAREVFEEADDRLGYALSRLCFEGPESQLNDTFYTQPAILTVSIAAWRAWQARGGPSPDLVAGHSLGEFTALVAAGALSFPDALYLVQERGRWMKRAGEQQPGAMAAVLGMERAALEEICAEASQETGEAVVVANDNCPGQLVISGGKAAVARAGELARGRGAKRVVPLAVSIAAHSPLMAPAVEPFQAVLKATPFHRPSIPVISNVQARPLQSTPEDLRVELAQQLTAPVRWTESIQWMIENGVRIFVEFGPRDVLSGLIRRIAPEARTLRVEDPETLEQALRALD